MNAQNSEIKILVVDDVPYNIQIVGNMLQHEGYDVSFANNGTVALNLFENRTFDLVLLDIMMPGIDGFEVCQRIKANEKWRDIPIIFLTAKADVESLAKGFEIGGQDYVTKPFNHVELLARVRTHLELKAQRLELKKLNDSLENKVKERTLELERANKQLSVLDKAKSDFLLLINHELRTPLNGILGFTKILESTMQQNQNTRYIQLINKAAHRLNELAEVALLITSLRADAYAKKLQTFSCKDVVNQSIGNVSNTAFKKNVGLEYTNPIAAKIEVDINLAQKALDIILDNAIKFSPDGTKILITNLETDKFVIVTIIDHGSGFTTKALHELWEFFTTESIMHHSTGFGLGLATCKMIMTAMNGNIEVNNVGGGGACVKLLFRIAEK